MFSLPFHLTYPKTKDLSLMAFPGVCWASDLAPEVRTEHWKDCQERGARSLMMYNHEELSVTPSILVKTQAQ